MVRIGISVGGLTEERIVKLVLSPFFYVKPIVSILIFELPRLHKYVLCLIERFLIILSCSLYIASSRSSAVFSNIRI